jgi:hypothetical protein
MSQLKDPVRGMPVDPASTEVNHSHEGTIYRAERARAKEMQGG